MIRRYTTILTALLLLVSLAGCQAYKVTGIVVAGREPGVAVVDASDERLRLPGLDGAVVELTIDPDEIRPKLLPATATDSSGRFSVPVGEPGAGVLEYELQIVTVRRGYQNLWQKIPLPGGGKRLVITMAQGSGGPRPTRDIVNETLKAGEELLNK